MIVTSKEILFFGSGPVAAKSLEKLSSGDFQIEAVITKPAINKRDPVPVIEVAKKLGIDIYTPSNKKELDQLFDYPVLEFFNNEQFSSELAVLIDYGIIVSQNVIDHFPLGIVNSHFSLLPEWRGADPITFSILSGQKETGVSLMLLNARMDEGPLLAQESLKLEEHFTEPELTNELIDLSDKMLKKYLSKYRAGLLKPYPQNNKIKSTYSRKLTKQDGEIDWKKSADQIDREIRAYISWPKSHANIFGKDVIITKVSVLAKDGKPGSQLAEDGKIIVYCKKGALAIEKLKPLGKNEMDSKSFLAGYVKT